MAMTPEKVQQVCDWYRKHVTYDGPKSPMAVHILTMVSSRSSRWIPSTSTSAVRD